MVVERVLGNLNDINLENRKIDKFQVQWYEIGKKILKKTTSNGIEVGLKLMNGHLHDGDILFIDENTAIVVDIEASELILVEAEGMKELCMLCYEIGNRHLPINISDNKITIPYDHPTFEYIKKIGYSPEIIVAKFIGAKVCNGHSH